jgi:hypothetical protein
MKSMNAKEFFENNYYSLAEYDEGGFIGIDEVKVVDLLNDYANQLPKETLRDKLAMSAMHTNVTVWNSQLRDDQRKFWEDALTNEFGNIPIEEALAKDSYKMADIMLKARTNN